MAEPDESITVTFVQNPDLHESEVVIQGPQDVPWSVVLGDWRILILTTVSDRGPARWFAFTSVDEGRAWAEAHGIKDVLWDARSEPAVDLPEGWVERFERIAQANDVPTDSAEAVAAAKQDPSFEPFSTLTFYPLPGATRDARPPWPIVTDGRKVPLPWTPASCSYSGHVEMWDASQHRHLILNGPSQEQVIPTKFFAVHFARAT